MSFHIDNWTDGLLALRAQVYETRGYSELVTGIRVPNTTPTEALMLAVIFDRAVRANGTPGLTRRWNATLYDLEQDLDRPGDVYADNRSFWATLESAAVFLDSVDVPPPDEGVWIAALDYLDMPAPRNAGPSTDGPIAHFDNIHSYDDLYLAQYRYLCDKRGSDVMAPPPGFGGVSIPIPRATNGDVAQLALYWSDALDTTQHEMGYDAVRANWSATVEDVARLTQAGKATEVYAKNNEFWRDLKHVAIQVAVSDEAPTKWDLVVDSVEDSFKQLPGTLAQVAHDGAAAVTSTAKSIGKELIDRLGTPVLLGAGLVGLVLFTRKRRA